MSESTEVQRCAPSAPGPPCGQQLRWTLQHHPHSGAELGLGSSGADASAALAAMLPFPLCFRRIGVNSLCFREFACEAIWSWTFVCWEFISRGWKVQDQGGNQFSSWWEPSFWFVDSYLLIVFTWHRESEPTFWTLIFLDQGTTLMAWFNLSDILTQI